MNHSKRWICPTCHGKQHRATCRTCGGRGWIARKSKKNLHLTAR